MAWEMGYGWFVDASSGIDVNGVYNFSEHF